MTKVRSSLIRILWWGVAIIAYWNIWSSLHNVADLRPRSGDGLVILEDRYKTIREVLVMNGYAKGPLAIVTNRDLQNQPPSEGDKVEWVQGQYVLAPWILVRDRKPVWGPDFSSDPLWIIGDFWDGPPAEIPNNFVTVHDTGKGLILFKRKPLS